jgi:hypothetical protein
MQSYFSCPVLKKIIAPHLRGHLFYLFLLQVCMLVTLNPVLGDHIWDKEK